jgi:hypothetical protein
MVMDFTYPTKRMKNFLLSIWYRWKEYQYERKCIKHLGMKPQTMYVSKEAYDFLVEKINNPDPEQIESLRRILQRKSPWEKEE